MAAAGCANRSRADSIVNWPTPLSPRNQDDPELAAGFVEADGLDCLMRLANGANGDQIHQNYILRGN